MSDTQATPPPPPGRSRPEAPSTDPASAEPAAAPAEPKPELLLNRPGQPGGTVADALNGFIAHAATAYRDSPRLDIAAAYFNLGGYTLLADSLDELAETRILLGAEPEAPENRPRRLRNRQASQERTAHSNHSEARLGPEPANPAGESVLRAEPVDPARAQRVRLQRALSASQRSLITERDMLGFTPETSAAQQRLIDWLRSEGVQVRRLETRFLHGKAFLAGTHDHGVIAGSSNFTYAGLARNEELNLGSYSPTAIRGVQAWYDELWAEAADYDLAALFEARFEQHSPELIYLRMLWELYGAELHDEATTGQIRLTQFQEHGVWQAERILDRHNGVLIADEVGLGKTFVAGVLIEKAALERRQRVLVIAPATLRDGPWRAFMSNFNLPMELVSFDELAADERLNPARSGTKLAARRIDAYSLVVIDEAHNLRNPSTQRAAALRRLLQGSPAKQVVMLTTTPINNSLMDLYHQLGYFIRNDAALAEWGVMSLRDEFEAAMRADPDDLTGDLLFDVIDQLAVKRTRSFIKRWYSNDRITIGGVEQTIKFPTPRVHKVSYNLDGVLPGFFERIATALDPDGDPDDPGVLSLARYEPSAYLLDPDEEELGYERRIAGLLRSGMLKRFESSPHAFANTCDRMAKSCDAFVTLLDAGRVAAGDALAEWAATDFDDSEDGIDAWLDHLSGSTDDAGRYDHALLAERTMADRELLRSFATEARTVARHRDPNLAALKEELADIAADAAREGMGEADERNKRKVLIFSYFADTVEWIYEYLLQAVDDDKRLAAYRGRIAWLTGSSSGAATGSRRNAVWGFAPLTAEAPEGQDDDLYDILVCTDVLAEGVNLQQARHIANYDLPWNPMRLVQRHGRIDRIGSLHDEVFIRCVFPDSRLDDLLGLEERLNHKIRQAAAAIGTPQVLPHQRGRDKTYSETREEIERLQREEAAIFEKGATAGGTPSGEEFRQQLREAIERHGLQEQIASLPYGSGSGMAVGWLAAGRSGFVFCVRVGDDPKVLYRYVELDLAASDDEPTGGTRIRDKTPECLELAQPADGPDTPRVLDDATQARVFDAWEIARADVLKAWATMTDKKNLEPRIAKALREACRILRETRPPCGHTQESVDAAISALSAPLDQRLVNEIRAAMRGSDDRSVLAGNILEVVRERGLQPYVPPEAWPPISTDDVHLVCWQALAPSADA